MNKLFHCTTYTSAFTLHNIIQTHWKTIIEFPEKFDPKLWTQFLPSFTFFFIFFLSSFLAIARKLSVMLRSNIDLWWASGAAIDRNASNQLVLFNCFAVGERSAQGRVLLHCGAIAVGLLRMWGVQPLPRTVPGEADAQGNVWRLWVDYRITPMANISRRKVSWGKVFPLKVIGLKLSDKTF